MQRSVAYTLLFATAVCVVCAVVVSGAAVQLAERQEVNARLDKNRNVLEAAGLSEPGEKLTAEQIEARFDDIRPKVVELATGQEATGIDPATFDQKRATRDPATSREAPANPAQVQRLPRHAVVYEVLDEAGRVAMVILPVEGKGLWSTLYGFLAIDRDLQTIRGLTFYQHGETPGLGGEVDNPTWKARWPGRKAFGPEGEPRVAVVKGRVGSPAEDPYEVDGLSGATLTSRGVTYLLQFWLGENGFGPYLEKLGAQLDGERRAA